MSEVLEPTSENGGKTIKSKNREDFLRRFFSVAVSVGFANQIGPIFSFLLDDGFGSPSSIMRAFLLISAMVVVIGSWEFYFKSIEKYPLNGTARFSIDITIVSMYVLLLLSTQNYLRFNTSLVAIMLLYSLWDLALLRERFPSGFPPNYKFVSRENRGQLITIWWATIFMLLFLLYIFRLIEEIASTVAMIFSYIMYRMDQGGHFKAILRTIILIVIVVVLLVCHEYPSLAPNIDLHQGLGNPIAKTS